MSGQFDYYTGPDDGDGMTAPTHELKVWPEFFAAIRDRSKTFEVRRDDRGFAVGDILRLREWVMEGHFYTGAEEWRRVTYKLGGGQFGVEPGFCVLGLAEP